VVAVRERSGIMLPAWQCEGAGGRQLVAVPVTRAALVACLDVPRARALTLLLCSKLMVRPTCQHRPAPHPLGSQRTLLTGCWRNHLVGRS
jgi:hypothetical protein